MANQGLQSLYHKKPVIPMKKPKIFPVKKVPLDNKAERLF
jgi:hypothetical protein